MITKEYSFVANIPVYSLRKVIWTSATVAFLNHILSRIYYLIVYVFLLSDYSSQEINRFLGQAPNLALVLLKIVPKLQWGFHIGWWFNIRLIEHGNDRLDDRFYAQDRSPPFICCFLCVHRVCAWRVQNRDAHFAVRVNYTHRIR